MPKAEIDTPRVTVRLEGTEVSISELAKQALDLFREATAVEQEAPRHQMGFAGQYLDRRGAPDHVDHNYRGSFDPVHAKEGS